MSDSLSFCPDRMYDHQQTWNTTNPHVSRCLSDTVLTVVPCTVFWLILALRSSQWKQFRQQFHSDWTKLLVFKIILTSIMMLSVFTEFFLKVSENGWNGLFLSDYIHLFPFLTTLPAVMALQLAVRNSSALLCLWSLLSICGLPSFIANVESLLHELDPLVLVVTLSFYPAVVVQLFGTFFKDTEPKWDLIDSEEAPIDRATLFSNIVFSWMDPIIRKGYKETLTLAKLPKIPNGITLKASTTKFRDVWNEARASGKMEVSLAMELLKCEKIELCVAIIFGLIHHALLLLQPLLFDRLLDFTKSNEPIWRGLFYITFMFILSLLVLGIGNSARYKLRLISFRMMSRAMDLIYRKVFVLSNAASLKYTTGEMLNFFSVDSRNIKNEFVCIPFVFYAIFTFTGAFCFLLKEMGLAAIIMVAVTIILQGSMICTSKLMYNSMDKLMESKDTRVELIKESIASMKVIKLYGWELPFQTRIHAARKKETGYLKFMAIIYGVLTTSEFLIPFVMAVVLFNSFAMIQGADNFTVNNIFVSLALIDIIRSAMSDLPNSAMDLLVLRLSFLRISNFLNAKEVPKHEKEFINNNQFNHSNAIEMDSAYFFWKNKDDPVLKNISFNVRKGSLVAIVGGVGSGKTSLLSALLNRVNLTSGSFHVHGTIAYCPQNPWILSMSLKENITLVQKSGSIIFYSKILQACALATDIDTFPAGDATEIGENGVNLSGGQKQRLSLARAVMSDSDTYLLDDPLSALDPAVAKHVFSNVLDSTLGLLKNKTRVLVTNAVSFLDKVDHIIVLDDGRIAEEGSYSELIDKDSQFSRIVRQMDQQTAQFRQKDSKSDHFNQDIVHKNDIESTMTKKGNLVEEESMDIRQAPWRVYKEYILSIGLWATLVVRSLGFLSYGLNALGIYCLSIWTDGFGQPELEVANKSNMQYLQMYLVIGMGAAIVSMISYCINASCSATAAGIIHQKLTESIFKSQMSFFDSNPLGRIMNRFSSDINILDLMLPEDFVSLCNELSNLIVVLCVTCFAMPIFTPLLIPLGLAYWMLQKYYNRTNRQLKFLEISSLSPIFCRFSESLSGISSIKAYSLQNHFFAQSQKKIEDHVKSCFYELCSVRWLNVRVGLLGIFFTTLVSSCVVLLKDSLSIGTSGMAIYYAMSMTNVLQELLDTFVDLESDIVCLERIMEYYDNPQEGDFVSDKDQSISNKWPVVGNIDFHQLNVRYRHGLDLTLKDLSLSIDGNERIGICGRTGAGKSTLVQTLLRILKPDSGQITIDGTDISSLGLHMLRSKLTLIPQDPVLFLGTVRYNLDPTMVYEDKELWSALEHVHMKAHIQGLDSGLDHEVRAKGENFSGGQKQLLCLARALLRKTKILILDEATASLDFQTDSIIQSVIRTEFAQSTVITIAHRINTIIDYDRVVVIDDGSLKEIGSPESLLTDKGSLFSHLFESQA